MRKIEVILIQWIKQKKIGMRRVGSVLVQNYNLRRICILLCFVILVETGGLVIQSLKSSVAPYVIEVDSTTGLVKNVGIGPRAKV